MAENSDFFVDETVNEMAEDHVATIISLEERQAKRIIRNYTKIRQELRDRLDSIPNGTYTAQKMRATLVQLELAIQAMGKGLKTDMKDGARESAEKGTEDLIKELKKWNKKFTGAIQPINLKAVEIAADTSNFLFNRYDASMDAYNEMLRSRMAQSLTESVIAQDNLSDVTSRLGKIFHAEEWKLLQIARTELHGVYNLGKLNGMASLWKKGDGTIPDLKKTLFHPMDKRTGDDSKRLNANNPIVNVDEPFIESSLGYKKEYMAPPNRPNDRAILIPYRDEWAKG